MIKPFERKENIDQNNAILLLESGRNEMNLFYS